MAKAPRPRSDIPKKTPGHGVLPVRGSGPCGPAGTVVPGTVELANEVVALAVVVVSATVVDVVGSVVDDATTVEPEGDPVVVVAACVVVATGFVVVVSWQSQEWTVVVVPG